jgi:uncharacterized membrane protein
MSAYLSIKLIHILSATILFGTGLGTAFFMLKTYLNGNREAIAVTTRNVVLADWIFTTPAVIVQLTTGLWLTRYMGIPFGSVWFVLVAGLFVFVGACWIPVVWIQIRIREIVSNGGEKASFQRLMRIWIAFGVLAFSGVLLLFFLMVSRFGVDRLVFHP